MKSMLLSVFLKAIRSRGLKPSRIGKATEYKLGHHYLTVVEWPDGHCEIEVHKCVPEQVFHTCDMNELETARDLFLRLGAGE